MDPPQKIKKYTPYLGVMKMPFSIFIKKKLDIIRYLKVLYILRFVRYYKCTGLQVLPYILGYSQTFSDISRKSQILSYILKFVRYCKILLNIHRYCQIYTGIARYSQISSVILGQCQILSYILRIVRYCKVLLNIHRPRVLPDIPRYFQILSDIIRYSQIFSDIVLYSQVCQIQ